MQVNLLWTPHTHTNRHTHFRSQPLTLTHTQPHPCLSHLQVLYNSNQKSVCVCVWPWVGEKKQIFCLATHPHCEANYDRQKDREREMTRVCELWPYAMLSSQCEETHHSSSSSSSSLLNSLFPQIKADMSVINTLSPGSWCQLWDAHCIKYTWDVLLKEEQNTNVHIHVNIHVWAGEGETKALFAVVWSNM